MRNKRNLKEKIRLRIHLKKDRVFLREDFEDLADYDQVGRALRILVSEGELIKLGYGVYAKTKESSISRQKILIEPLPKLAREAMDKLGYSSKDPSDLDISYRDGSTQVPTGRVVPVNRPVSRELSYKDATISYEQRPY